MSEAPEIPILYEDNHLLVIVKPPGLLSQSDGSGAPDVLTLMKASVKRRHQKPGQVYLGLVHRLDRPVGGVMVLARTSKGAARLSAQIRERRFEKVYLAEVEGCPTPQAGELCHALLKDTKHNVVSVVDPATPRAQEARLEYVVESFAQGMARVRIQLHTGRPHQIRVQMAAIGCPLVGDRKYGASSAGDLALWACQIGLEHPTRGEWMTFAAPWPAGERGG